jgi:hypothetical protein
MKEQFRILVISALVFALARSSSSCASAPTPVPSTTPTVAPPATVSTVPPATATVVAPATAATIPSATPPSGPTTTAATPPTNTPTEPAVTQTTAASSTTPSQASAAATSKTVCLACHPYDSIIAASANYVMPSGETHSPHRYVNAENETFGKWSDDPHHATGVENIPECGWCHTAHPLPLTGTVDLSNMGLESCYSTCHHQNNFAPCGGCHVGSGSSIP